MEYGFAAPRKVWAKVKGYLWWPGQVFDPADTLVLAMRERRGTGAALVACFEDRSFVWAGVADLSPLHDDFPHLAGLNPRRFPMVHVQLNANPNYTLSLHSCPNAVENVVLVLIPLWVLGCKLC